MVDEQVLADIVTRRQSLRARFERVAAETASWSAAKARTSGRGSAERVLTVAACSMGVMSDRASTIYLAHVKDQLTEQRDRKKSLEQRGQTSVAVSSGLVTLILAFSDVGALDLKGSPATTRWLTAAIVPLVLGAIVGVIVTVPLRYAETKVAGMWEWLGDDHWTRDAHHGERAVAKNVLGIIEAAKTKNQRKAWLLTAAVLLQVLGVAVMAARLPWL